MPCWRKANRGSSCFAQRLFVVLLGLWGSALADGIAVKSAEVERVDETYQLNADFDIAFSPSLEDALNRGVPLNFVLEFELWRPRRFWFSETISNIREDRKLAYNALTRQYRLSIGTMYQNFSGLDEAIRVLSTVRASPAAEPGALKKGYRYEAALRLWLDLSQLPKPFQVNALASRDWQLSSQPYRWSLTP